MPSVPKLFRVMLLSAVTVLSIHFTGLGSAIIGVRSAHAVGPCSNTECFTESSSVCLMKAKSQCSYSGGRCTTGECIIS